MGIRRKNILDPLKRRVVELLQQGKKPKEVYEIFEGTRNQLSLSAIYKIRRESKLKPGLIDIAQQFINQLCIPPPETVPETLLTHDFSGPGPHSFPLREDVFSVICHNLGYDISKFRVYRESSGTPTGDIQINVAVSDYGILGLFAPLKSIRYFQNYSRLFLKQGNN